MEEQRELIFHNSVPLEESALPEARARASRQKDIVLDFFRQRFSMSFTPHQVQLTLEYVEGNHMLLTSVRRCITDLTKEGKLIKCDWNESKPGAYVTLNRTWRYNRNFINPLNPQK